MAQKYNSAEDLEKKKHSKEILSSRKTLIEKQNLEKIGTKWKKRNKEKINSGISSKENC